MSVGECFGEDGKLLRDKKNKVSRSVIKRIG